MSSRTKALLAIIVASLLWATSAFTSKILLRTFEPFSLAFWRFLLASIVILPYLFSQRHIKWRSAIKDIIPIALLSTANITFFYFGLQTTTANASSIIYAATPLVTTILAHYLIQEHWVAKKMLGIIIGLLGVLLITLLPLLEGKNTISGDLLGNILIFIAVFAWGGYTVGSRHLISKKRYSPLMISGISIVISAFVFLLTTAFTSHKDYIDPLLDIKNFALVLYLAVFVTVGTYFLFQWAIKHSSATTASLNNYLSPVFAVWLNVVILGELLTPEFIIGSLLVIFGVFITTGTQLIKEVRRILS